jgi:hypothetical protein
MYEGDPKNCPDEVIAELSRRATPKSISFGRPSGCTMMFAVHDPAPVGVVQRLGHRGQHAQAGDHVEGGPVTEQLGEGDALDVLHHEVVLAHVEDADDVGMGEPAGGLGLPAEPPQVLGTRLARQVFGFDGLDRDVPAHHRVEAAVDAAHGPVPDLGVGFVTAEGLEGGGRHTQGSRRIVLERGQLPPPSRTIH